MPLLGHLKAITRRMLSEKGALGGFRCARGSDLPLIGTFAALPPSSPLLSKALRGSPHRGALNLPRLGLSSPVTLLPGCPAALTEVAFVQQEQLRAAGDRVAQQLSPHHREEKWVALRSGAQQQPRATGTGSARGQFLQEPRGQEEPHLPPVPTHTPGGRRAVSSGQEGWLR